MRFFGLLLIAVLFFVGCSTSKHNTVTETYIAQKQCKEPVATLIVGKIAVNRGVNDLFIYEDDLKKELFKNFKTSKCFVLAGENQTDRFLAQKYVFDVVLSSRKRVNLDDGVIIDKKTDSFEVELKFDIREYDVGGKSFYITAKGYAESEKTLVLGLGKGGDYANEGRYKALDKALQKARYEIESSLETQK